MNDRSLELAKATGMSNLIEISFVEGGLIDVLEASCVVECGFHNSRESAETAYETVINFLAANNVIRQDYSTSKPSIFEVYGREKGSGYKFTAGNFSKVEKGEIYAEKQNEVKEASEVFYPVLMSTDGYDDMIGFKAKRIDAGK